LPRRNYLRQRAMLKDVSFLLVFQRSAILHEYPPNARKEDGINTCLKILTVEHLALADKNLGIS
jgi:hypothetical protein